MSSCHWLLLLAHFFLWVGQVLHGQRDDGDFIFQTFPRFQIFPSLWFSWFLDWGVTDKFHILLFPAYCICKCIYCKALIELWISFIDFSAEFSKWTHDVACGMVGIWLPCYQKGKVHGVCSLSEKALHCLIIKTYFNRKSAPSRFNFAFSAHRLELGGAFGDLATRWWALQTKQIWCHHS